MLDVVGPGSLKLIIGPVEAAGAIDAALTAQLGADALRQLAENAWLAFTAAEPEEVRSWIGAAGGPAFVVEFERWSALGLPFDPAWLLRRGH